MPDIIGALIGAAFVVVVWAFALALVFCLFKRNERKM